MARKAVDPGAQLQPALPRRQADGAPAAGPWWRLRLDPGDARPGRRIPAAGPAEPVGPSRRGLEHARLGIDPPALDRRWLVAGPASGPQPTDAGRAVARSALIIRPASRPERRARRQRIVTVRDPASGSGPSVVEPAHRVGQAARLAQPGRSALVGPGEELGEPAIGLEVAPDHHRVVGLERLRHAIDERSRKAQRHADLPDRRPRPVRDHVADHPGVLRPVGPVDVLNDLLPALRAEVDVDVRVGGPALVDEPLEQQVVADRVHPGDPEHVGHDRIGRAAPALGGDAALAGEAHEVPADQEELGETGSLDHRELMGELAHDRRRERVIAAPGTVPAELRQMAERRLPVRHGKAREAVLLEAEIDRAAGRQLGRVGDPLGPRRRDRCPERPVGRRQASELRG